MSAQPQSLGCRTARVRGQESYLLSTETTQVAISALGGMLGPVTFFPAERSPIRPYAIAPWCEEPLPPDTPPMLAALRGDWFCSAFGENIEPYRGERLPPHGESANRIWRPVMRGETSSGSWLKLRVDLPSQGGHCESTTVLIEGHSVIYQCHELSGLTGPINPGHHATLACPDRAGAGRLSFSRLIHVRTHQERTARPEERGYSWLKPGTEIADLDAVPCINGSTTDVTLYPARRGFEDLILLCADPTLDFAWSAVTFAEERYVWFSLRNPRQLASTLLWFSNGGRHFPPWNGRHVNVLGIEDITGFFHAGIAASCRPNLLTERGIPTCLEPEHGRLSIPYIQGVARVPPGFERVAAIEASQGGIALRSARGPTLHVPCHLPFLRTGTFPWVEFQ